MPAPDVVQLGGVAVALAGVFQIYEPAALIAAGVLLVLYVEGRR